MLVHVVDVASTEGRDPVDDIEKINDELFRYSPELAKRPQLIAANKCDVLDPEFVDVERFEAYVRDHGWELIYISAATGENMKEFVNLIGERLRELPPVTVYEAEETAEEVEIKGVETTVRKEGNVYVVEGEWLFNLLGQVNPYDRESLAYFGRVLTKYGVIDLLEENGCKNGDTVSVYDFEFDFVK